MALKPETMFKTSVTDIVSLAGDVFLVKCWNDKFMYIDTSCIIDTTSLIELCKKEYKINIHITRRFNSGYLITLIN